MECGGIIVILSGSLFQKKAAKTSLPFSKKAAKTPFRKVLAQKPLGKNQKKLNKKL
jgi:hypothetical protein